MDPQPGLAEDEERLQQIAAKKVQRADQAKRSAEKAAKARAECAPSAVIARTEARAESSRS
jgi:hypothetical protein